MRQSFKHTAETPKQKRARLEKQAKEIADALKRPSIPQPKLTPDGKLRHDGNALGRQALETQRVDINKQIDKIIKELDERRPNEREIEKTFERDMGRSR